MLFANGLLVWSDPLFHCAYAYTVDGGEFGEGAGLDLGCLDCAGHIFNLYFLVMAIWFFLTSFLLLFFFASPKKNQKRSPTKDYIPFVGWYPDWAFVLL